MTVRKVLVTGASGYIAAQLLPALRERFDLTLLDDRATDRDGNRIEGVEIVDLTNSDRRAYREWFRGVETVVHLGYIRPPEDRREAVCGEWCVSLASLHTSHPTRRTVHIVRSIETERIDDENGVPFQVFYGISDNSHAFWSLVNARRILGYAPEDNSWLKFADRIGPLLAAWQEP